MVSKKRKPTRDEPVTLYREGEDPEETLRALLEVKQDSDQDKSPKTE